jgi:hypothetical protein
MIKHSVTRVMPIPHRYMDRIDVLFVHQDTPLLVDLVCVVHVQMDMVCHHYLLLIHQYVYRVTVEVIMIEIHFNVYHVSMEHQHLQMTEPVIPM